MSKNVSDSIYDKEYPPPLSLTYFLKDLLKRQTVNFL